MSTPTGITPPDDSRSYATPEPESTTPWIPIGIGAAAVLIAVALVIFFTTRPSGTPTSGAPDPYASSLSIADVTLSTAQNFAGHEVTYIEGRIQNNGDKTVDGATVQAVFKNSLGETVDRQSQPLAVIRTREPYIDTTNLKILPLKPGQSRDFRLTFERISADWNQQKPLLQITRVSTQ